MGTMAAIQAVLVALLVAPHRARPPSSASAGRAPFPARRTARPACRTSPPGCWRSPAGARAKSAWPRHSSCPAETRGGSLLPQPASAIDASPSKTVQDAIARRRDGETGRQREQRTIRRNLALSPLSRSPCLLVINISMASISLNSIASAAERARRHDDFDFFHFIRLERDGHAAAVRPFQVRRVGRRADQALAGCGAALVPDLKFELSPAGTLAISKRPSASVTAK